MGLRADQIRFSCEWNSCLVVHATAARRCCRMLCGFRSICNMYAIWLCFGTWIIHSDALYVIELSLSLTAAFSGDTRTLNSPQYINILRVPFKSICYTHKYARPDRRRAKLLMKLLWQPTLICIQRHIWAYIHRWLDCKTLCILIRFMSLQQMCVTVCVLVCVCAWLRFRLLLPMRRPFCHKRLNGLLGVPWCLCR